MPASWPPAPSSSDGGRAGSAASESVITQVTTAAQVSGRWGWRWKRAPCGAPRPMRARTRPPPQPPAASFEVAGASYAPGGLPPPPPDLPAWTDRVRALLCCLPPRAPRAPSDAASDLHAPAPPRAPPFLGDPVIGPQAPGDAGRKLLVLDLDETLVHSSFRPAPGADFVIPVEIDGRSVDVHVLKRPHVDEFLAQARARERARGGVGSKRGARERAAARAPTLAPSPPRPPAQVGARFEVVVFTASLAKYADPLLDLLDAAGCVRWRLFREHCVPFEGNYVKDLQCLGRPLADTVIVDNSPHSYVFQPDNAVPVSTFIDDPADTELLQILPVLLAVERVPDVRPHLAHHLARLAEAQASRGGGG